MKKLVFVALFILLFTTSSSALELSGNYSVYAETSKSGTLISNGIILDATMEPHSVTFAFDVVLDVPEMRRFNIYDLSYTRHLNFGWATVGHKKNLREENTTYAVLVIPLR